MPYSHVDGVLFGTCRTRLGNIPYVEIGSRIAGQFIPLYELEDRMSLTLPV